MNVHKSRLSPISKLILQGRHVIILYGLMKTNWIHPVKRVKVKHSEHNTLKVLAYKLAIIACYLASKPFGLR